MQTGDAIMASIATAITGSSGAPGFSPTVVYPGCDGNGNPVGITGGDDNYAYLLFFCKATADGANPESIRGSFKVEGALSCAMQVKLSEIYATPDAYPYTAGGTDLAAEYQAQTGDALSITVDTTCFPQAMVDETGAGTVIPVSSLTAYSLDPIATGYQKRLVSVLGINGGQTFDFRFFQIDNDDGTLGRLGFKLSGDGTSPSVGSVVEVMIDVAEGVALYNSIDDRFGAGGADSAYRRDVRFQVTGPMTIEGLTSITSMQGIFAESGATPSVYADLDNQFSLTTVGGNPTDGFTGFVYGYNSPDLVQQNTTCSLNTSCASEPGLPAMQSDAVFYLSTGNQARVTHINSGLSLCSDGTDLTFAPVPMTGALGICN